jgi:hypothetical protein
MDILLGVGGFLAILATLSWALKMITRGTSAERVKLTPEQREEIARLESDLAAIDGRVDILRRCIVTSTSQWSINYWNDEITILTARAADYRSQIESIKNPTIVDQCWVDAMGPGRQALDGCGHGQLIEVESDGQVVSYICQKCNEQVMPDDRAAKAHQERKAAEEAQAAEQRRVNAEWSKLWNNLGDDRKRLEEEINLKRSELARAASDNGLLDRDVAKHLANLQSETFDTTYTPSVAWGSGEEGWIEVYDGSGQVVKRIWQGEQ